MTSLLLSPKDIITLDDCRLCSEGKREVGYIGERSASLYKTSTDPAHTPEDWLVTLQKSNVSDPERGFTLLLLPIGHITAFSQIHSSRELASNFGIAFAKANYAMQLIRQEDWMLDRGIFMPQAVVYGKCASALNTQEHLHMKVYTLDGAVNQPSPSDTDWAKREVCIDEQGAFVKAKPVVSTKISDERFNTLAKRLTEIINTP